MTYMPDATCYRCGQSGHYKAHCPGRYPPTTEPGALSSSAGVPASHIDLAELRHRVPEEVARERAERHASQIRAATGWSHEARETRLRARALELVAESRGEREWITLSNEGKRSVFSGNSSDSMAVTAGNRAHEGS